MDEPRPSYLSQTDPEHDRRRRRIAAGGRPGRPCGVRDRDRGREQLLPTLQGAAGRERPNGHVRGPRRRVRQGRHRGARRPGSDPVRRVHRRHAPADRGQRERRSWPGTYRIPVGSSLDEIVKIVTTPPATGPDGPAHRPRRAPDQLDVPGGAEHRERGRAADRRAGSGVLEGRRRTRSSRCAPYLPAGNGAEGFLFPETYRVREAGDRREEDRAGRCSTSSTRRPRSSTRRRREEARATRRTRS